MTGDVTQLQSTISTLSVELNEKIGDVKETLDKFRGEVNERVLREQVAKTYGHKFSEARVVEGLVGLARMVGARKHDHEYQNRPHDQEHKKANPDARIQWGVAILLSRRIEVCATI